MYVYMYIYNINSKTSESLLNFGLGLFSSTFGKLSRQVSVLKWKSNFYF